MQQLSWFLWSVSTWVTSSPPSPSQLHSPSPPPPSPPRPSQPCQWYLRSQPSPSSVCWAAHQSPPFPNIKNRWLDICLPHFRANNLFDFVLGWKEVAATLSVLALLLEYQYIFGPDSVGIQQGWLGLGHITKLFACYVGFVHTLSESTGGATGAFFSGSLYTPSLIIFKLT